MKSTRRYRVMSRATVAAALLVAALSGCSDPEPEEGVVALPGQQPPSADDAVEPSDDPTRAIEVFLSELRSRNGLAQPGVVRTGDDGTTTLWVHADPDDQQWVADRVDSGELDGVRVIAVQPIGANADASDDARRFSTTEVTTWREAVADLVSRLSQELADGEADDPDSYPATVSITVEYGVEGDDLTVALVVSFDRLPASAEAELRDIVPAEALDLRLDATE